MNLSTLSLPCFLLLAQACGGGASPTGASSQETTPQARGASSEGDFFLTVANGSYARPSVDIAVYIDDVLVAEGEHSTYMGNPRPEPKKLRVAVGQHRIRAVTKTGEAVMQADFGMPDKPQWCAVSYWYSPGQPYGVPTPAHIKIRIREKPIELP